MLNKDKKDIINNEIVEKFNSMYENKVSNINEILDELSETFQDYYGRLNDAQNAFNCVADEYSDLMKGYCFVYSLSGDGTWSVDTGDGYNESDIANYINIAKENYIHDDDIEDIYDVLSLLENDVMDTMSNVGCDPFTALNLILEEDFCDLPSNDIFVISGADEEPRIEILYH